MNDDIEYPQCFIIREKASEDAIWFVRMMDETEDMHFQPWHSDYVNSRFVVEVTTLSEAETYNAFDIAPIGTSNEFIAWIDGEILSDIEKSGNIITGTKHFGHTEYPCYYLVLPKGDIDAHPICVYPIKSEEQNIEMPISWWKSFNEKLFIRKIDYNEFEGQIAINRVFEYNVKELLDRVGELTKKGA